MRTLRNLQTRELAREYQRVSYFGGLWKPEYEHLIDVVGGRS